MAKLSQAALVFACSQCQPSDMANTCLLTVCGLLFVFRNQHKVVRMMKMKMKSSYWKRSGTMTMLVLSIH